MWWSRCVAAKGAAILCMLTVLVFVGSLSGCLQFKPKPPTDEPPVVDDVEPPVDKPSFFSADSEGSIFLRSGAGLAEADVAGAPDTDEPPAREVVEPDVIRKDGSLLYILNQYRGLTIVDLESRTVVGSVPTLGYPRDLYLVNGMAYVLTGYAADARVEDGQVRIDIASRLYAVDVRTPTAPSIVGELALEGDFVDSRLVGTVLYAVSASIQYIWDEDQPVVSETGEIVKSQVSSSWVTSVNLADPSAMRPVETLSLEGYGSIIQTGEDFLFVASPDWGTQQTVITLVDISNPDGRILTRGTATVEGMVQDRFKMNAWNGVLRVATNYWFQNASGGTSLETELTTFSLADPERPELLGRLILENASGETLYATRFDGPMAYLVTFLQVDPLFVIDLSDPAHPRKTGELKVPGYTVHIEPRGSRLIGIGLDDTTGLWKVAATLFDVSDPENPAELSRVIVGDNWGWSPAFSDVKALTVLDDMILLPVSGWTGSESYDRVQWIRWSGDTLTPMGSVDVQGAALRTFRTNNLYYCVTPDEVDVIALQGAAPQVLAVIPLTSDVRDCVKVSNGIWVRIVAHKNGQAAFLETAAAPYSPRLAETALPDADIVDTLTAGNEVIVISRGWDAATSRGYYSGIRVRIDGSGRVTPVWNDQWAIEPWWGWGWWGWYDVMSVDGPTPVREAVSDEGIPDAVGGGNETVSSDKRILPGYWWWPGPDSGKAVLLAGDKLVLRCYGESWSSSLGGEAPWQGLAFVDAASGVLEGTVGLGFAETGNIAADLSGRVTLSYKKSRFTDDAGRPVCAWYLALLDPVIREVIASANVPGNLLSMPGTDCYVLEDWQYSTNGQIIRQLNTIFWPGVQDQIVEVVESIPLGQYLGDLVASGGTVWLSQYAEQWGVERLAFSGSGRLAVRESKVPGPLWGTLLAWDDSRVCAQTDGNVLIQLAFSGNGAPEIEGVTGIMGWPVKSRIVDATSVVCLGKAGIALLEAGIGLP